MIKRASIFGLVATVSFVSIISATASADETVEWACAIPAGVGGLFYSDSAVLMCDAGGQREKTEISPNSAKIFCNYHANCTPVTPRLKTLVTEQAGKDNWRKLSEKEMGKAMMELSNVGQFSHPNGVPKVLLEPMTVQCMGGKTENGSPDCPTLNNCMNNRKQSRVFFLKPATAPEADGSLMERPSDSAPRKVTR